MVTSALFCVAAFLLLSPIAVALSRSPRASGVVYASCLIVTLTLALVGGMCLIGQPTSRITLPLGLPWLGAHFRLDALSAFFLIVVNLGGAAASLFALGYGQHEQSPERVLPFYPAYLAGMNLVVLADDASARWRCFWRSVCLPATTATISSSQFASRSRLQAWRRWSLSLPSSARDPRQALSRFTPGCRSPIRPLPATSLP
jgi:hydrogenase-4 component B